MFSRIASEGNRAVFTRVVESIYSDYGGKEQCPWSVEQLKGAYDLEYNSCICIPINSHALGVSLTPVSLKL